MSLDRQTLAHPGGETALRIGRGAIAASAAEIAPWLAGRTVFALSTPRVRELHGEALEPLRAAAGSWQELEVEDGETAKSVGHAARLWDDMLARGGKRDSRLVTFGGGTVGDLGGFVAGCFLRGISYAQLPTTLLAQVDAAIGGKTGIDLRGGKNTVGLFHHPRWVLSDTAVLGTLPAGELRSGLVEVVKMAALLDVALLDRVEQELEALLAGDADALAPVVAAAAAAKRHVVERDPGEGGYRRVLNFGHTLGHALEAATGYRGLRHGEAVAYGIVFACRLARRRGYGDEVARRLEALLGRFALPPLPAVSADELLALVARDKKATERGVAWVLPRRLGEAVIVDDLSPREVADELTAFLAAPPWC